MRCTRPWLTELSRVLDSTCVCTSRLRMIASKPSTTSCSRHISLVPPKKRRRSAPKWWSRASCRRRAESDRTDWSTTRSGIGVEARPQPPGYPRRDLQRGIEHMSENNPGLADFALTRRRLLGTTVKLAVAPALAQALAMGSVGRAFAQAPATDQT